MSEEVLYLTEAGARWLRQELDQLVNVERPALAARLREAIAMGDLTENADYADAKEKQAFLEGRVQEIEYVLRNATLVPDEYSSEIVQIGSRVTVVEEGEASETYEIVGVAEANPAEGRISNESPLGRALIGRRVGEVVTVAAPAGELRFKIEAIA